MMKIKKLTGGSLLLLAILFLALVSISNTALRGVRIDLTEQGLYTLTDGSKNIVDRIDEPLNLYFFYSDEALSRQVALRAYAEQVKDLLQEYASRAGDRIRLQVIDPRPFSEEEDLAASFGLQGLPLGENQETVYFGLAGTNSVDDSRVIPFFDPSKEVFLEYDISKLLYGLVHTKKPVIGLFSSLSMQGGFDPMMRQPSPAWVIYEQVQSLFEIRQLSADVERIDPDVDLVWLVHPKSLSESALYALDQYALSGGKLLVFVDPLAEQDVPPQDPANPAAAMMADRSSDLEILFKSWGVVYDRGKVLADHGYGLQVSRGMGAVPVRHLGMVGVHGEGLDPKEIVVASLGTVNLATSGVLAHDESSGSQMFPLLQSSDVAMTMDAQRFQFLTDPASLNREFEATGERYVLAARFEGEVVTAYPEGLTGEKREGHLAKGDIRLMVVADTDLLSDRLWVRTQNFFGQQLVSAWASNGDFVYNSLDVMTGSADLIAIRGREVSQRPFEVVERLKRDAEIRLQATEETLQQELRETESKLADLQSGRGEDSLSLLSPEQEEEIQRFVDRKLQIRKELREVRRELDADIESLGRWLKVINIILLPLVLTAIALWVATAQSRRKSR